MAGPSVPSLNEVEFTLYLPRQCAARMAMHATGKTNTRAPESGIPEWRNQMLPVPKEGW